MHDGSVCAAGSPLFLKKAFDTGYHLTVEKGERFDDAKFTNYLKSNLSPKCKLERDTVLSAVYQVPREAISSFPKFLRGLENAKSSQGILSYGVASTTMDDVFLASEKYFKKNEESRDKTIEMPQDFSPREEAKSNFCIQMGALLIKKYKDMYKHWYRYVWVLIFVVLISLGLASFLYLNTTISSTANRRRSGFRINFRAQVDSNLIDPYNILFDFYTVHVLMPLCLMIIGSCFIILPIEERVIGVSLEFFPWNLKINNNNCSF